MFSKCWRDSTWQKLHQSPLFWQVTSNYLPVMSIITERRGDVSSIICQYDEITHVCIVCNRPDLAYAVSIISRFMSNLEKQYRKAVKWVLRYLWGTTRLGLVFQRLKTKKPRELQGNVDVDYAGDLDQQRLTTSYVLIVIECVIS